MTREESVRRLRSAFGLDPLNLADFDLALTHRSYGFESGTRQDNERLEFLGDAIIGAVASEFLYARDAHANEGLMSKRRARLVSRTQLGRRALALGLDEVILLGRGERESGGAQRASTLGSALEALVGIVYLRLGWAAAHAFTLEHILQPLAASESDAAVDIDDAKSALQEWTQQYLHLVPTYTRLTEEGPMHARVFRVQVSVAGRVLAEGSGPRIKLAENEAAKRALDQLRSNPSAE